MGIHVILDVEPRGIDAAAWAAACDDTLVLLEAWRPRLLGWGTRAIGAVELCVFARSIRVSPQASDEAGWSVVGDRESMQTAESLSLYRNLDRYARRRREAHGEDDVVIAVASAEGTGAGGPVRVFGGKTQGCPYHLALLAAAMLIEERFPRRAMVSGNIDRGQAEQARDMAALVLGRNLELPVCVDAPRLIDRLRTRYEGDALVSAFDRVFLNDPMERIDAMLRCFPGPEGARWWIQQLGAFAKPTTFGGIGLLTDWLNAGRDLRDACYLAWARANCVLRKVRCALFENAELRRYAIEIGRDPRAMAEFDELLAVTKETDAGP